MPSCYVHHSRFKLPLSNPILCSMAACIVSLVVCVLITYDEAVVKCVGFTITDHFLVHVDAAIRRQLETAQGELKMYQEKEKKMFQGMFKS